MSDKQTDGWVKVLRPEKQEASADCAPAPCSAAASKYFVRWLPEGGGKAVAVGTWEEVMEATKLLMGRGVPCKIEIGEVVEMPPNNKISHRSEHE